MQYHQGHVTFIVFVERKSYWELFKMALRFPVSYSKRLHCEPEAYLIFLPQRVGGMQSKTFPFPPELTVSRWTGEDCPLASVSPSSLLMRLTVNKGGSLLTAHLCLLY